MPALSSDRAAHQTSSHPGRALHRRSTSPETARRSGEALVHGLSKTGVGGVVEHRHARAPRPAARASPLPLLSTTPRESPSVCTSSASRQAPALGPRSGRDHNGDAGAGKLRFYAISGTVSPKAVGTPASGAVFKSVRESASPKSYGNSRVSEPPARGGEPVGGVPLGTCPKQPRAGRRKPTTGARRGHPWRRKSHSTASRSFPGDRLGAGGERGNARPGRRFRLRFRLRFGALTVTFRLRDTAGARTLGRQHVFGGPRRADSRQRSVSWHAAPAEDRCARGNVLHAIADGACSPFEMAPG